MLFKAIAKLQLKPTQLSKTQENDTSKNVSCTSDNATKMRRISVEYEKCHNDKCLIRNLLVLWDFSRFRKTRSYLRVQKKSFFDTAKLCSFSPSHQTQQKVKINERENIMIPFNHKAFNIFFFFFVSHSPSLKMYVFGKSKFLCLLCCGGKGESIASLAHFCPSILSWNDCLICLPTEQYFHVHSSKSNKSLFYCLSIVWNNLSNLTLAHERTWNHLKDESKSSFLISLLNCYLAELSKLWAFKERVVVEIKFELKWKVVSLFLPFATKSERQNDGESLKQEYLSNFLSSWHLSCCERAQSTLIRLIFYVIFSLLLIIFQFSCYYFSLHVYISFIVLHFLTFLTFQKQIKLIIWKFESL